MKKPIVFALKIALVIFILWFLMHSSQLQLGLLLSVFKNPFLTAVAILFFFLMVIVCAWRWYRLNLAQGICFSFKRTLMPTYLGIAFNNLLPGTVGGDFVRLFYLFKKFPNYKSGAALSIFFDRLTGLMGIFILASIVALFQMNIFSQNKTLFYFFWVCFAICLGALLVFFVSMLLPERVGLSAWLTERFSRHTFLAPVITFMEAIRKYRQSKLIILECLAASLLIQLMMVVVVLLINRILGLPMMPVADFAIALCVTQLVNLIPLAPGGIGLGEVAFANILLLFNPTAVVGYATVFLVYRLLGLVSYLPGLLFYLVNNFDCHNEA